MNNLELVEDLSAHEEQFFGILTDVQIACDALLDASTSLDGGKVRQKIRTDRETDPLLYYFWKARNAATHHILCLQLSFQNFEFELVDPSLFRAASAGYGFTDPSIVPLSIALESGPGRHRLFRKLKAGRQPVLPALERAGMTLTGWRRSIALRKVQYIDRGTHVVANEPTLHLGLDIPNSADYATEAVIKYYDSFSSELAALDAVQ